MLKKQLLKLRLPLSFDDAADSAFMGFSDAAFFTIINLWLLISAALVFLMHLGFATLESGLGQAKNTVNILFKNVFIISMGLFPMLFMVSMLMYPGFWIIGGRFCIKWAMVLMSKPLSIT